MRVLDRVSATLAVDQIGRNQGMTPEGFLLCSDVRIARTGPMLYTNDEMPDIAPEPGRNMITIERNADVLFHPDAILSFAGKSVTNDHPSVFVTPATVKRDEIGVVLNPRRGEGLDSEYLIADLLIKEEQAIKDVKDGKREVSCGYDAEREAIKPGYGRQTKVIGNHVALVDRGRCGPACAILDSQKGLDMAKRTTWDRLRTYFKNKDEAAFEEEVKKAEDAEEETAAEKKEREDKEKAEDSLKRIIGDAIKPISDRLTALDAKVAKIKDDAANGDDETEDSDDDEEEAKKKKAEDKKAKDAVTDSASLAPVFNDTLARAEILAPGIGFPTFDAKATSKATTDAICALRVKALDKAYNDPARRAHVVAVLGGKPADFAKMTCDAADVVFHAASELARSANNQRAVGDRGAGNVNDGPMTAAKLQAQIVERRKANPK